MKRKSPRRKFPKSKDQGFNEGFTPKPFDRYTEAEREEILQKAAKEAALAMNVIRENSAFYYHLIMQVDIKFTVSVPRAATDYKSILIHPVWWISISPKQQAGALLHEVMHIVMLNAQRRGRRNGRVWNIACDIVNNGLILGEFKNLSAITLPPNVAIRRDLEHLSAEEVYEILLKEKPPKGDDPGGDDPGGDEPGGSPSDPSDDDNNGDDSDDSDDSDDGGDGGDDDGGDGDDGDDDDGDDGDDGGDDGDGDSKKGKESDPGMPEEDIKGVDPTKDRHVKDFWKYNPGCLHDHDGPIDVKKVEGDIKNILRRSLNQARKAGTTTVKGATEEFIQRYLGEPMVDWRDVLRDFVTKSYDDFQGPFDRRLIHRGYYFETLETENVTIYFAIDTSGSIASEEIAVFLGELRSILRLYPSMEAKGFWADAAIYGPYSIESMIESGKSVGGGGTSFVPFFEWIKKNSGFQGVEVAIYFTDGLGEFPKDPPNISVLWVVLPGGLDSKKFPFGKVVRLIRSAEN